MFRLKRDGLLGSQRLIRYLLPNILLLGLSLIAWGCTTNNVESPNPETSQGGGLGPDEKCRALSCKEQVQLFSKQFPKESDRYTTLSPAPCAEQLDYLVDMYVEQVKTTLNIIKERLDDSEAARKALDAYTERYDWEAFFRMAAGEGEHQNRMEPGDSVHFFKYRHPSSEFRDYGYIVLRDGEIVFRMPHGSEGKSDVIEEEELPYPYVIDKL